MHFSAPVYIAHMVDVVKCFQDTLENVSNGQLSHPICEMGTDQILCRT